MQRAAASHKPQGPLQVHTQQSIIPDNASTSTQVHPPTVANGGGALILAASKAYLVTDLVQTAIESFCSPLSERMIHVIEVISKWVQSMKQAPSRQELEYHRDLVGELFFLGKLEGVPIYRAILTGAFGGAHGLTQYYAIAGTPITVFLDPRDRSEERRTQTYAGSLFGVYLHELCHVFFARYGCTTSCGMTRCQQDRTDQHSGHGWAWFLVAVHVQTIARRFFPSIDIRMGIFDSILLEYQTSRQVPAHHPWLVIVTRFSDDEVADFLDELLDIQEQALDAAYQADPFFGRRGLRVGIKRLQWIRDGRLPGWTIENGVITLYHSELAVKIPADESLGDIGRDELLRRISYPPLPSGFLWAPTEVPGEAWQEAKADQGGQKRPFNCTPWKHTIVGADGKLTKM